MQFDSRPNDFRRFVSLLFVSYRMQMTWTTNEWMQNCFVVSANAVELWILSSEQFCFPFFFSDIYLLMCILLWKRLYFYYLFSISFKWFIARVRRKEKINKNVNFHSIHVLMWFHIMNFKLQFNWDGRETNISYCHERADRFISLTHFKPNQDDSWSGFRFNSNALIICNNLVVDFLHRIPSILRKIRQKNVIVQRCFVELVNCKAFKLKLENSNCYTLSQGHRFMLYVACSRHKIHQSTCSILLFHKFYLFYVCSFICGIFTYVFLMLHLSQFSANKIIVQLTKTI